MLKDPDSIIGLKLTDFGLSGIIKNSTNQTGDESLSGTLLYMAPELLSGSDLKSSTAHDVWSLGILAYLLITGHVPFDSQSRVEIRKKIIEEPVIFSKDMPIDPRALTLVQRMLDKNKNSRIKMHEIMSNPWLFPEK